MYVKVIASTVLLNTTLCIAADLPHMNSDQLTPGLSAQKGFQPRSLASLKKTDSQTLRHELASADSGILPEYYLTDLFRRAGETTLPSLTFSKDWLKFDVSYQNTTLSFTDWCIAMAGGSYAPAQWALSVMYFEGYNLPKDLRLAKTLSAQAEKEYLPATLTLCQILVAEGMENKKAKFTRTFGRAIKKLEALKKDGYIPAYHYFACLQANGIGVLKDLRAADKTLASLAKKGYAPSIAEMGLKHFHTALMRKSFSREFFRAHEKLTTAVNLGYMPAHYYIGLIHLKGYGTDVNLPLAEKHLAAAAKAGNPDADLELATLYEENPTFKSELATRDKRTVPLG